MIAKSQIRRGVLVSLLGAFLVVLLMTVSGIPSGFRPRVYWLLWSGQYKQTVLSSPLTGHQLRHAEWNGDGWGGAPVGDWTGYGVYDPSDSLPTRSTDEVSGKINGVPCDVVTVRRLERNWYSVVTDMNQFWDSEHPHC